MKRTTGVIALVIVSAALRPAHPVWAQGTVLPWSEVVGTWEQVLDQGTLKQGPLYYQPSTLLAHSVTFRPDSASIWTQVWAEGGDTLACSKKYAASYTDGDGLKRRVVGDSITAVSSGPTVLHLEGQRLVAAYLYTDGKKLHEEGTRIYKRVEPAQRAFLSVINRGFAPSQSLPTSAQPPTGTLADLVGTWKWEVTSPADSVLGREFLLFRADGTTLEVTRVNDGADTLWCGGRSFDWKDWQRVTGDSVITQLADPKSPVRLQGKQLVITNRRYKAVNSLQVP